MSCSSPISWLRLEGYHLGELASEERKTLSHHLSSCDACSSLLESIAADDKTDLPPLQIKSPAPTPITSAARWYSRPRTIAIVTGLALAAAILIGIGRRRPHPQLETDDPSRVKGNAVAFSLVREDSAIVPEAGGPYHDGERFKALVTCPPGLKARFDVVVFENGVASFPFDPSAGQIACGNSVALPGAFRVTGNARMTVCLVWQDGEGAIDRDVIRRTSSSSPDLLLQAQCKILEPTPP